MRHRVALLGATLAVSVPAGIVAAAPASASSSYPSSVRSAYEKSCEKAAEKRISSARARTACRASLKCVERKLTLSQFEKFGEAVAKGDKHPPHASVVARCAEQAAKGD